MKSTRSNSSVLITTEYEQNRIYKTKIKIYDNYRVFVLNALCALLSKITFSKTKAQFESFAFFIIHYKQFGFLFCTFFYFSNHTAKIIVFNNLNDFDCRLEKNLYFCKLSFK